MRTSALQLSASSRRQLLDEIRHHVGREKYNEIVDAVGEHELLDTIIEAVKTHAVQSRREPH